MSKYVVRVQYKKSCNNLIWTVKAKNDEDLERTINSEYQNCLDLIDGYEYEELKGFMFKKRGIFPIRGNWVGVDCMKYDLDKENYEREIH